MMNAWCLEKQGPLEQADFSLKKVPIPKPKANEVLIKISVCGVCRTDLHIIEGDLKLKQTPTIPGHQVVGHIISSGSSSSKFKKGQRVGVAWLGQTCKACSFCTSSSENLCEDSKYTGYHLSGGYAEYLTADEDYIYPLDSTLSDESIAPLLCAGIIGYRAYKLSKKLMRSNAKRLGLFGFGSSAHITAQLGLYEGYHIAVSTRGEKSQAFAKSMGITEVIENKTNFERPLDGAIIFAPAGDLIPYALENLSKGGVLTLAGISMTDVPSMHYNDHLFHEKKIQSVEANTREDGRELLALADKAKIHPQVTSYPLSKAKEALAIIKAGDITGSLVLKI